jgi:hypothetical protein
MSKWAAKGTKLQIGNGAESEVFTDVGELLDMSGPSASLGTADVTSHSSTAKECVATVLDSGEVTFSINYDPTLATHKNASGGLIYQMQQKTLRNWKIVFPDTSSSYITFSGFVTSFEPDAPVEGKLSAKLKIKISGAVVFP